MGGHVDHTAISTSRAAPNKCVVGNGVAPEVTTRHDLARRRDHGFTSESATLRVRGTPERSREIADFAGHGRCSSVPA